VNAIAGRVLTEGDFARIHAARNRGGICAVCGESLPRGVPVWVERRVVYTDLGGQTWWWVPVGVECVSADFRRETTGKEPEQCAGCGRGMYYAARSPGRRLLASCSRHCAVRGRSKRVSSG
jgi:hypothetical protein